MTQQALPRHASRAVAPHQTDSALMTSALVWLGLMAYAALVKVVLDALILDAIAAPDQRDAFSWPVIVILGLLGLLGVWLMQRTGFPSALEARISNRQRCSASVWPHCTFSSRFQPVTPN